MTIKKNPFYYLFFVTVLILNVINVNAQQKITAGEVESKSYQLYLENNWEALADFGETSLKEGYDYFYLRIRIGVAYYEQKKYNLAIPQFQKALAFNSKSEFAQKLLYYSYLFTGKSERARKLSNSFSENLTKAIKIEDQSKIDFYMLEIAQKPIDDTYLDDNGNDFYQTANYAQLGLKHIIKNEFSLFHALTYFSQQSNVGQVKQYQYFLQGVIPFKNNWELSPALHFVSTNFSTNIDGISEVNEGYWIGSFEARKSSKNFNFSFGLTFSNIGNQNVYNHFASIGFAPFGNNTLVFGLKEHFYTSNDYDSFDIAHIPFISFSPLEKMSVKLTYLRNNGINIIEDNGYLVNNSLDLTSSRFSSLIDYSFSNAFSLYGIYQNESKTHAFNNFDFKYNLFLLGVRITP